MEEKKEYKKPTIEVDEIELEEAICTSGGTGTLKGIDFNDLFGNGPSV